MCKQSVSASSWYGSCSLVLVFPAFWIQCKPRFPTSQVRVPRCWQDIPQILPFLLLLLVLLLSSSLPSRACQLPRREIIASFLASFFCTATYRELASSLGSPDPSSTPDGMGDDVNKMPEKTGMMPEKCYHVCDIKAGCQMVNTMSARMACQGPGQMSKQVRFYVRYNFKI